MTLCIGERLYNDITNFYKIKKKHEFLLGNKFTEGNLPFIVPVVAGVVEGNAGFVYTSVTGAGEVTPEQIVDIFFAFCKHICNIIYKKVNLPGCLLQNVTILLVCYSRTYLVNKILQWMGHI